MIHLLLMGTSGISKIKINVSGKFEGGNHDGEIQNSE